MAVWLFTLVVPVIMIVFGAYFRKHSPREINMLFGYRTTLSMKNRDTWEFAHRCIGTYWLWAGIALLPITVVPWLLFTESESALIAVMYLQPVMLISGVIFTEIKLRKAFDKDGKRR